jgi:hypothetical protein
MQQTSLVNDVSLRTATAELLRKADLHGDFSLQRLPGGGNNRVFRIEVNGCRTLLKAYFHHPDDRRDRLGAEFSFCAFAWENGLRFVPQPLARDSVNRLGLYEFIDGRSVLPAEIDEDALRQAVDFFSHVNSYRHLPAAQELPIASEAYFCLSDHLGCVDRRLEALEAIAPSSDIDREAACFVLQSLIPAWAQVRSWALGRADASGLGPQAQLPRGDRCLSPSDFGFHNAISTHGGRLRFIDFEYAGWDDPAKTVCDFLCQVAMPIPARYFELVLNGVASALAQSAERSALSPPRSALSAPRSALHSLPEDVALLMPVYRIKWCCIVLNEFVRVSKDRRLFANAESSREEKKAQQLQKARNVLQSVTDERTIYGLR